MIWNEKIETMDRVELESLQSDRLAKLAAYVCERMPFYKKKFDKLGIDPKAIKDIRDLTKAPLYEKNRFT